MGNYGIKISNSSFDVTSCDDKDLAFSSKFNQLKIHMQGTFSLTVRDSYFGESTSISHSLGYIPSFLVFCEYEENNGKKITVPFYINKQGNAYCDTGSLRIFIDRPYSTGSETFDGYYFIFKDNLT